MGITSTLANPLVLFHGSDHVIEHPSLGLGRLHNDFGRGFHRRDVIREDIRDGDARLR